VRDIAEQLIWGWPALVTYVTLACRSLHSRGVFIVSHEPPFYARPPAHTNL